MKSKTLLELSLSDQIALNGWSLRNYKIPKNIGKVHIFILKTKQYLNDQDFKINLRVEINSPMAFEKEWCKGKNVLEKLLFAENVFMFVFDDGKFSR